MIKVCIGLLSNRGFQQDMVLALNKMIHYSTKQETAMHFEMATEGYTIAENRSMLAAKAIKNDCTHLLMIDDDMIFPENTLELLLKADKDIIGVLYNPRQFTSQFMINVKVNGKVLKDRDELPKDIFEAEGVGFGTVLIKTDVIKKMERPWFDWTMHETGMVTEGEDFYFCRKARELGYSVWCEPRLKTGHIGRYIY
jgi:choline kinase